MRMKKTGTLGALALAAALLFSACSSQKAEIVMVTDAGSVEDKSFNQGTWEGVRLFAGINGKTCYYYQPASETDEAYLESIRKAVLGEVEVILLPGHFFESAVVEAQEKYPDVAFILLDSVPAGEAAANTAAITFAEEQAGYMAGWAAVMEGYRSLGFMGGQAVPGVVGFGMGFAQGAADAAAEVGEAVRLRYTYTGTFEASGEVKMLAAGWYAEDTEVIFACGGGMGHSVFKAAEEGGGKTIGVDIDQSGASETVLFSAVKALGVAAGRTLEQYYAGAFPGGETIVMGAAESAVGLSMESSRLQNFTTEDYETLYARLVAGEIAVERLTPAGALPASPAELGVDLSSLVIDYEE